MKGSRFSEEQIIGILKEHEGEHQRRRSTGGMGSRKPLNAG